METSLEWTSATVCSCKTPGPACELVDVATTHGGTVRLPYHVKVWASEFICLCPIVKVHCCA